LNNNIAITTCISDCYQQKLLIINIKVNTIVIIIIIIIIVVIHITINHSY